MKKIAIMALCLAGFGAAAATEPQSRLVMVVDRIDEVRNLPALLAESLGYFKEEGLLVTLVEGRDEVPTDQMLADGRADASMAFYHHTFMSQVAGTPTQSVVALGISPALKLMVADRLADRIKSPADLKGRKVFTGGANSGKTTTANWLLHHAGLGNGDIVRLPLQDRDKMAAALQSGEADAIIAHEPDASYYQAAHVAHSIADITTPEGTRAALGSLYPTTSVYMTPAYIKAHPEEVQHLVNALLRTLKYINSHKAGEIMAVLPKEAAGKNPEILLRDLTEDMAMFATDGLMPDQAARTELKVMADFQPKYAATNFEMTFTNHFVEASPFQK